MSGAAARENLCNPNLMRAAFIAVEAGEYLLVEDLGGTVTQLVGVRFLVNCKWKLHQVNFGAKKTSIAAIRRSGGIASNAVAPGARLNVFP